MNTTSVYGASGETHLTVIFTEEMRDDLLSILSAIPEDSLHSKLAKAYVRFLKGDNPKWEEVSPSHTDYGRIFKPVVFRI